jgi:hypothetical protein
VWYVKQCKCNVLKTLYFVEDRKMKKVLVILALLAVTGIASADLLSNGDFELGENDPGDATQPNTFIATSWSEWHSGGWSNREESGPTGFSYALGNAGGYGAGVFQDVAVADDGATYKLSFDASLDNWWMNSGYIKIEFLDAAEAQVGFVESPHFTQPGYDAGIPWTTYSLIGTAPAGTEIVRAIGGTYGEGGTARFDNAVLTVVPEPATMALLGLGALVLRRKK